MIHTNESPTDLRLWAELYMYYNCFPNPVYTNYCPRTESVIDCSRSYTKGFQMFLLIDAAGINKSTIDTKALLKSCVCVCSLMSDSAAPWTLAHQVPLSMEFSRKEHWNGLPLPTPGDLPNQGIEPKSPMSTPLAGRFFTTNTIWEGSLNSQQLFKSIVPTNKHKKSYCLYEG